MENPLCSCTPEPPPVWVKGVCVKCWHWKHSKDHRETMIQFAKALQRTKRQYSTRASGGIGKGGKVSLPCIHVGDLLTADELKANGLGEKRKWHRCNIGMAKNPGGIPGIACKCSGCGPKCEGYPKT